MDTPIQNWQIQSKGNRENASFQYKMILLTTRTTQDDFETTFKLYGKGHTQEVMDIWKGHRN